MVVAKCHDIMLYGYQRQSWNIMFIKILSVVLSYYHEIRIDDELFVTNPITVGNYIIRYPKFISIDIKRILE